MAQPLFDTANAEYLAHLYSEYLKAPANVDASWQGFFGNLDDDAQALISELTGASWTPAENTKAAPAFGTPEQDNAAAPSKDKVPTANMDDVSLQQATHDTVQAMRLIRAYRNRGHMIVDLDPRHARYPK